MILIKFSNRLPLYSEAQKVINLCKCKPFITKFSPVFRISSLPIVFEFAGETQIILNTLYLLGSELPEHAIRISDNDLPSEIPGLISEKIDILIWQQFFTNIDKIRLKSIDAPILFEKLQTLCNKSHVIRYFFNAEVISQAAFCRLLDIDAKNFNRKLLQREDQSQKIDKRIL